MSMMNIYKVDLPKINIGQTACFANIFNRVAHITIWGPGWVIRNLAFLFS